MANTYELLMKIGGSLSSSFTSSTNKAIKGLGLMQKATKPISAGIGSIKGKLLGLAGVAIAGISLDSVITGADTAEKNVAQLQSVLKSTGGAAKFTKQQALDLAGSLGGVTTFGKQTTLSAENMLLTFTNISGKTMPAATEAVLNMSQALGQDTKASAIQLGKSLNDPINGLTALKRVGVTFTDQQKKQIAAMQKAGNIAGAQKVILNELTREFGGSAKAAGNTISGQITRAKASLKGAAVTAFTAIMPLISNLMPSVVKGVQSISKFVQNHQKDIQDTAKNVFSIGKTIIEAVIPAAKGIYTAFAPAIKGLIPAIKSGITWIGKFIKDHQKDIEKVSQTIAKIGVVVLNGAGKAIKGIISFVTKNGPLVKGLIAGIGTAFVLWKVAGLINGVVGALSAFKKAQQAATIAQAALNFVMSLNPIGIIILAIAALVAALVVLYNKNKWFRDFVNNMFKGFMNIVKVVIPHVLAYFKMLWMGIKAYLQYAKALFSVVFSAVIGFFKSWWKGVQAVIGNVKAIFQNVIDFIHNIFTGNWKGAWQNIINIFKNVFGMIINIAKVPINAVIGLINGAIDGINKLKISIPKGIPFVGGKTIGFSIPHIPQLATGGIIRHTPGGILANIGEGRYDEAVVPLNGKSGLSGSGGDTFVYSPQIIVHGGASKADMKDVLDDDKKKFDQQMRAWIREHKRVSPSGKVEFA